MAVEVSEIRPVTHLPLILGMLWKLEVTARPGCVPPAPSHHDSCLWPAGGSLDLGDSGGHHALYKVGQRLEERGMLPLLQPGLRRASLNDYRLGQILDVLFAANLGSQEQARLNIR